MSRSKRKPYVKDKGISTEEYWRPIRREWKSKLNFKNVEVTFLFEEDYLHDIDLRQPKEIINDYDYCDYWFYVEIEKSKDLEKYSRK